MSDILVQKNLNRWFREKWVDVSRKDKDGKHPPCGRSEAKTSSKGYPKCRPSIKVSSKTPKTSGSMSSGQKQAATKRKRAKKQGVGGKPTIVKTDYAMRSDMDAFTAAWNVLKATLPIKPETMQWETDPKSWRRYKQTGGVARRGREKMLDETQAKNNDLPFETDVMDQFLGRDEPEDYKYWTSPDIYGNYFSSIINSKLGPRSYAPVEEHLSANPSIDRTGTPEEIAERVMMREKGQSFLRDIGFEDGTVPDFGIDDLGALINREGY